MHMHMPPLRRRKQRAMTGTPKLRARIQALGCRGKLSQATSTASRPPRSPDDGADPPKHARRQSKLPPTPVDTLRPPEPPQPTVFFQLRRRKSRRHLVLLAQHKRQGREARDPTPTRSRRAAVTSMGPVLDQEQSQVPGGLSPTWASSVTPLWRNSPAACTNTGGASTGPLAPDAPATPQTRGARERGRRIVSGPRAPRRTERRLGHDVEGGGKLCVYCTLLEYWYC